MSAGQSQHRILLVCCSKLWQDNGSVWQHWDFSLCAWLSLTVVLITNSLRIPSALRGNLTGIAAGNLMKLMKRDSLCEVDLCESHWYNDRVLLYRETWMPASAWCRMQQSSVRLKSGWSLSRGVQEEAEDASGDHCRCVTAAAGPQWDLAAAIVGSPKKTKGEPLY